MAEEEQVSRRVTAETKHRHLLCRNVTNVAELIGNSQAEGLPSEDRPHDLLTRYSADLARDSMLAAST
ncbi:hypothetical protein SAMN04488564_1315 [Lentzea waywayandensis]|uniref:Uncharacterized protein n=1 Tax=Lentzea waywayandensis TaxID=84724 RepID=A0A1I6FJQ3_9PSEU|nr:hypothetical protein [Lentzea waywayandensis]SFR30176.1 hypothetical protein SAMN04488564_1315 [Lentzea waywayandensis]